MVAFAYTLRDTLGSLFIGRPIEENSGNQTALARAVNWAKECETHPDCSPGVQPLPSRVVDVGDADDGCINLRDTAGRSGTYVTLSHCWGSSTPFTAALASLEARKRGIDFSGLPKTFQDSVVITRALGVRYLWIDSLCICQDDIEDWERESAKMASIYAGAYLKIAATRAKNGSVGCFAARTPRRYVSITYSSPSMKQISGQLMASLLPLRSELLNDEYVAMPEEPLSSRAWVLQERVLSRRTLHYGKDQMYFECNNCFLGENGLRIKERYHNVHLLLRPGATKTSILKEWRYLVLDYGRRKLTMESDKLPALSGIAQIFAEKLNDKYIAGLWRNSLIDGLLWQASRTRRFSDYSAPSWSWASLDCVASSGIGDNWKPLAKVIDCDIELKGLNPYGQVKSGWLKLQAPLEPLILDENFDPAVNINPKVRTETGDPDGVFSHFDFDYLSETAHDDARAIVKSLKGVNIFVLLLAVTSHDPPPPGTDEEEPLTLEDEPLNSKGSLMSVEGWSSESSGSSGYISPLYHGLIVSNTGEESDSMRHLGFVIFEDDTLGYCKYLDDRDSVKQPIVKLV